MMPSGFEVIVIVSVLLNLIPPVLFVVVCIFAIRWFLRQEKAAKDPEAVSARRMLGEVLRSQREVYHMT